MRFLLIYFLFLASCSSGSSNPIIPTPLKYTKDATPLQASEGKETEQAMTLVDSAAVLPDVKCGVTETGMVVTVKSTHQMYSCDGLGNWEFFASLDTATFKDGAKGDTGAQGEQGIQGIAGATGLQGEKGDQGTTGLPGPQGLTGSSGAQGIQGITGSIGAQGIKGDTGNTGAQGLTGPQGNVGVAGPQGIQGLKGDKGDIGNTGAQGVAGAAGAQGIQGTAGVAGAVGPQGIQGLKGDTGDTGAQGTQGVAGSNGANGSTWMNGAGAPSVGLGAVGDYYINTVTYDVYNKTVPGWGSALMNIKGATGAQGTAGATGLQGLQGLQGPQGVAGNTGPAGPAGQDLTASTTCRTGYIMVPKDNKYTFKDFCVMKYEAKRSMTTGMAVSTSDSLPWVYITQGAAKDACQTAGGAHLINNGEWMTIARNIESNSNNDIDAAAGTQLATGHSDYSPQNILAASTDNDPYFGTGDDANGAYAANVAGKSQKRIQQLSNGNIIWDLSGNAAEYLDANGDVSTWPAQTTSLYNWNTAYISTQKLIAGPNGALIDVNGAGKYQVSPDHGAMIRGGDYSGGFDIPTNGATAGIFALSFISPSGGARMSHLGFRCAYNP